MSYERFASYTADGGTDDDVSADGASGAAGVEAVTV